MFGLENYKNVINNLGENNMSWLNKKNYIK